jgi:hypothetical protein
MDRFMAVQPGFARDLELVKPVLVLAHQSNGEKPDLTRPSNATDDLDLDVFAAGPCN